LIVLIATLTLILLLLTSDFGEILPLKTLPKAPKMVKIDLTMIATNSYQITYMNIWFWLKQIWQQLQKEER